MAKSTENLQLYEKESTDSKDTFNIQTMLNDNWDKIDLQVAKKTDIIGMVNEVKNETYTKSESDVQNSVQNASTQPTNQMVGGIWLAPI